MSPSDGGGTIVADNAAKQRTLEGGRERTSIQQSNTDTSCLPVAGFALRAVFWFARLD